MRGALDALLTHLLKWQYQPDRRGRSWRATIEHRRVRLERHLGANPSLKSQLDDAIQEAYLDARYDAAKEADIDPDTFPADCPFAFDQIMDEGFWPD